VISCARALAHHKLGQSFFVLQEFELSEKELKIALDLFQKVQDGLKLRFLNSI